MDVRLFLGKIITETKTNDKNIKHVCCLDQFLNSALCEMKQYFSEGFQGNYYKRQIKK